MRTTLNLDDDILLAVKALARREKTSIGAALSSLAREALAGAGCRESTGVAEPASFYGFEPLPSRGVVVTDALIDRLREEGGEG